MPTRKCQLCELPITEGYEVKYFKAFYHPGCATIVAKQSTTFQKITELKESVKEETKEKEKMEGEKRDASLRQNTEQKSATQRH